MNRRWKILVIGIIVVLIVFISILDFYPSIFLSGQGALKMPEDLPPTSFLKEFIFYNSTDIPNENGIITIQNHTFFTYRLNSAFDTFTSDQRYIQFHGIVFAPPKEILQTRNGFVFQTCTHPPLQRLLLGNPHSISGLNYDTMVTLSTLFEPQYGISVHNGVLRLLVSTENYTVPRIINDDRYHVILATNEQIFTDNAFLSVDCWSSDAQHMIFIK